MGLEEIEETMVVQGEEEEAEEDVVVYEMGMSNIQGIQENLLAQENFPLDAKDKVADLKAQVADLQAVFSVVFGQGKLTRKRKKGKEIKNYNPVVDEWKQNVCILEQN
ncbi:hypothetical protein SUGI_0938940 [Cryptomeria japonica]|nr:hypothetical protein SUGI_0938940 [Cryptomeria japonica]